MKKNIILVLVDLFFTIAFMLYLSLNFGSPKFSIFQHVLVVLWAFALIYFVYFLLLKCNVNKNKSTLILVSLLTVFLFFQSTVYILNTISNHFWGGNVYNDFYQVLNKHVLWFFQDNNFWLSGLALGLMTAFIVVFVSLKYFLQNNFKNQISNLSRHLIYSLLYVIFFSLYFFITFAENSQKYWKFDPMVSVFTSNLSLYSNADKKRQAILDAKYRSEFVKKDIKAHSNSKNIVLIVVDSLRFDRIKAAMYHRNVAPFMQSLTMKKTTQTIDQFRSLCSESSCGILSILTSRPFNKIGYSLYDFTDVLKDIGYRKYFYLSGDHYWKDLRTLYEENHDKIIDGTDFSSGIGINDDLGVLKELKKDLKTVEEPFVMYVHLMSAHFLGIENESSKAFKPSKKHPYYKVREEEFEEKSTEIINAYDNGVLQADRYVKEIFKELSNNDLLTNSIVVVTSDHGEPLGEGHSFYHTNFVSEIDLRVPFIFYNEKQSCDLNKNAFGVLTDIAPTILDCLGIDIPTSWEGVSLKKINNKARYTFHHTLREKKEVAVIKYDDSSLVKMLASVINGKLSNFRVFDLISDPNEANDLYLVMNKGVINELTEKLRNEFLD